VWYVILYYVELDFINDKEIRKEKRRKTRKEKDEY
jgi:hypothetical protein